MNIFIIIISSLLGATLTFYVCQRFKLSAVKSSALLSLVVGLFFYCFPDLLNSFLTKNIPIVFFGTSFIGMVSSKIYVCYFQLLIAGILFSLIYSFKSDFFEGFGGALGALAFISLLITMVVFNLILRNTNIKEAILKVRNRILNKGNEP